jgi:hypothetical protein
MKVILNLLKELKMQALLIKIFKLIYFSKIHPILLKKVKETETEIDDKFLLTLNKFVDSL